MRFFKPDYKNPQITTDRKLDDDVIVISKRRVDKIRKDLDNNIQNGWTLVYFDELINTVVVTNGGNEVSEFDYEITRLIQKTINELFKEKK